MTAPYSSTGDALGSTNKIFQAVSAGETLNSPQIIPNNIPEEATGDIDPGIYEGTGKGFEK